VTTDVAIVGGGPAGAALAILLGRAGHDVVLFERAPAYRWRAGGVFTSPATVAALRQLGLPDELLATVARLVPAMRVETPGGVSFRLTYGDDGSLKAPAVGLDRAALDPALLDLAVATGVDLLRGGTVTGIKLPERPGDPFELRASGPAGRDDRHMARVLVGADGIRSQVARSLGVARPARFLSRIALTWHLADPALEVPRDARMRIIRDGYIGIAPVPRGRVNVGIVLGNSWRGALRSEGADALARRLIQGIPATLEDPADWRQGARQDSLEGASPVGHRVTKRAGPNWFLVGDAAGFLDPFTGEGIHRGLVSAELAARAIDSLLDGRRTQATAAEAYERAMRAHFRAKDLVSLLVQGFLGRPALLEYAARRLARRSGSRDTMSLVMGDLVRAERALDPRFLAALLAP
jgi:flavin-dependent dehydrogenase